MRRHVYISGRKNEQGLIISLVAIFMLFVVGAMAALAIDVTSFYTARSEAQLVADSAALAGARVLANSGMTSTPTPPSGTEKLCENIANQVAISNSVGGQTPTILTNRCDVSSQNDPTVTVKVQVNVPTFFARIWGTTQVTIMTSAVAEAYNPSGLAAGAPVAPSCVKPMLFPNTDPTGPGPIFDPTSGQVPTSTLLGSEVYLTTTTPTAASQWKYFAGDTSSSMPSFPPPSSVTCSPAVSGFSTANPYQMAVAGCVQTPITCNTQVGVAMTVVASDTNAAVNCLSHAANNGGDALTTSNPPPAPFEFAAGNDDPLVVSGALSPQTSILVSDSLVTVPVYTASPPPVPGGAATLVGFAQLFLNPAGTQAPDANGNIDAIVVNLVGCGTSATGTPVYGNGSSAVAVRLITKAGS